jgi:hypothetical protein
MASNEIGHNRLSNSLLSQPVKKARLSIGSASLCSVLTEQKWHTQPLMEGSFG